MNQQRRDQQEVNPALSEAELRATIYFAVGVTSESGNQAYALAVAGDRAATARLEPADNSGYSLGTIQTDLGQHYQPADPRGENVPRDLVNAYQGWAARERPNDVLSEEEVAQTISDLGRNGRQIKAQDGRALDATVKSNIDNFLASDQGVTWVHERDVAQVNKLMREAIPALQQSEVYQNSSLDEQVRLATVVSKAYNQNETASARLLTGLRDDLYQNFSDVSNAIDGLSPRAGDYFEGGRDRALLGAKVVNALRNADPGSPLRASWDLVRDNSLTNPTQLHQRPEGERLVHAYPAVRNLFVEYDRAPPFINALNVGGTYAYGRTSREDASRFSGSGLYAAGYDMVVWNASGKGDAYLGGTWQSIDRDDLVKTVGPRGIIDIGMNTPTSCSQLLHMDPNAPQLRPAARRADSSLGENDQPFAYGGGAKALTQSAVQTAKDPLLEQAEAAVRRLGATPGREYDDQSACMAASAACLAKANGLSQIDHIFLSEARGSTHKDENLFVVQGAPGDPAHLRAQMKTQDAIDMPVEKSLGQLQAMNETPQPQHSVQIEEARQQTGPQMRMS